ncbi:uncharacterized protein METZ01_LOCUS285397, partial [marine metagenome]
VAFDNSLFEMSMVGDFASGVARVVSPSGQRISSSLIGVPA